MPAVNWRICALMYSLCEQRDVPLLVTDLIASYLDKQDILTINTLSRKLNDQANSVFYHDVVIDLTEPATLGQRAALLLRSLLTSKTAASHVRSLSLSGKPLRQWMKETPYSGESRQATLREQPLPQILVSISSFSPKEIELYKRLTDSRPITNQEISLASLCLDIINQISYLQELHINSDYFRYPDFRRGFREIVDRGGFQNLQSSSLCLDIPHFAFNGIDAVRYWEDALITPFLATNIKSIAVAMTLQPQLVCQLSVSSLTRLVLHHSQAKASDLNGLLAATPSLCYLEYHTLVDYNWLAANCRNKGETRPSLGLEALFDALHHVSDTLKELVTSQKFVEDCPHFQWGYGAGHEPPFRLRKEMVKLKHLQSLTMPYASILGWTCKPDLDFKWCEILPASLRQINLTDGLKENFVGYDCWMDDSLIPVFSGLLAWLASCRQGNQPLKFTLRLQESHQDFLEPERRTLSKVCEQHGILCSIEKLIKDIPRRPTRAQMPRRGGSLRGRGRG